MFTNQMAGSQQHQQRQQHMYTQGYPQPTMQHQQEQAYTQQNQYNEQNAYAPQYPQQQIQGGYPSFSQANISQPHQKPTSQSDLFDFAIKLALSTILPISKLSILYPVIMSGSLSLTNSVICFSIVSSSSAKV